MHIPSQYCQYLSRFNKTSLNVNHMNGSDDQNQDKYGILHTQKPLPDKFQRFMIILKILLRNSP